MGRRSGPGSVTKKSATGSRYQPNEQDRKIVELMCGHGVPLDEVRLVILNPITGKPVGKSTLMRHFRHEIDSGMVKANAEVAGSLFRQAVGRAKVIIDGEVEEEERPPNTSAAIWWTKARMGWKANGGEEDKGPDGGQIPGEGKVTIYIPDNGRDSSAAGTARSLSQNPG